MSTSESIAKNNVQLLLNRLDITDPFIHSNITVIENNKTKIEQFSTLFETVNLPFNPTPEKIQKNQNALELDKNSRIIQFDYTRLSLKPTTPTSIIMVSHFDTPSKLPPNQNNSIPIFLSSEILLSLAFNQNSNDFPILPFYITRYNSVDFSHSKLDYDGTLVLNLPLIQDFEKKASIIPNSLKLSFPDIKGKKNPDITEEDLELLSNDDSFKSSLSYINDLQNNTNFNKTKDQGNVQLTVFMVNQILLKNTNYMTKLKTCLYDIVFKNYEMVLRALVLPDASNLFCNFMNIRVKESLNINDGRKSFTDFFVSLLKKSKDPNSITDIVYPINEIVNLIIKYMERSGSTLAVISRKFGNVENILNFSLFNYVEYKLNGDNDKVYKNLHIFLGSQQFLTSSKLSFLVQLCTWFKQSLVNKVDRNIYLLTDNPIQSDDLPPGFEKDYETFNDFLTADYSSQKLVNFFLKKEEWEEFFTSLNFSKFLQKFNRRFVTFFSFESGVYDKKSKRNDYNDIIVNIRDKNKNIEVVLNTTELKLIQTTFSEETSKQFENILRETETPNPLNVSERLNNPTNDNNWFFISYRLTPKFEPPAVTAISLVNSAHCLKFNYIPTDSSQELQITLSTVVDINNSNMNPINQSSIDSILLRFTDVFSNEENVTEQISDKIFYEKLFQYFFTYQYEFDSLLNGLNLHKKNQLNSIIYENFSQIHSSSLHNLWIKKTFNTTFNVSNYDLSNTDQNNNKIFFFMPISGDLKTLFPLKISKLFRSFAKILLPIFWKSIKTQFSKKVSIIHESMSMEEFLEGSLIKYEPISSSKKYGANRSFNSALKFVKVSLLHAFTALETNQINQNVISNLTNSDEAKSSLKLSSSSIMDLKIGFTAYFNDCFMESMIKSFFLTSQRSIKSHNLPNTSPNEDYNKYVENLMVHTISQINKHISRMISKPHYSISDSIDFVEFSKFISFSTALNDYKRNLVKLDLKEKGIPESWMDVPYKILKRLYGYFPSYTNYISTDPKLSIKNKQPKESMSKEVILANLSKQNPIYFGTQTLQSYLELLPEDFFEKKFIFEKEIDKEITSALNFAKIPLQIFWKEIPIPEAIKSPGEKKTPGSKKPKIPEGSSISSVSLTFEEKKELIISSKKKGLYYLQVLYIFLREGTNYLLENSPKIVDRFKELGFLETQKIVRDILDYVLYGGLPIKILQNIKQDKSSSNLNENYLNFTFWKENLTSGEVAIYAESVHQNIKNAPVESLTNLEKIIKNNSPGTNFDSNFRSFHAIDTSLHYLLYTYQLNYGLFVRTDGYKFLLDTDLEKDFFNGISILNRIIGFHNTSFHKIQVLPWNEPNDFNFGNLWLGHQSGRLIQFKTIHGVETILEYMLTQLNLIVSIISEMAETSTKKQEAQRNKSIQAFKTLRTCFEFFGFNFTPNIQKKNIPDLLETRIFMSIKAFKFIFTFLEYVSSAINIRYLRDLSGTQYYLYSWMFSKQVFLNNNQIYFNNVPVLIQYLINPVKYNSQFLDWKKDPQNIAIGKTMPLQDIDKSKTPKKVNLPIRPNPTSIQYESATTSIELENQVFFNFTKILDDLIKYVPRDNDQEEANLLFELIQ